MATENGVASLHHIPLRNQKQLHGRDRGAVDGLAEGATLAAQHPHTAAVEQAHLAGCHLHRDGPMRVPPAQAEHGHALV